MKLNEGWKKHSDGDYSADMSELEAFVKSKQRDPNCPSCKAPVRMRELKSNRNAEGEVTMWKHTCPHCDAKLTVFNESYPGEYKKITFRQFINITLNESPEDELLSYLRKGHTAIHSVGGLDVHDRKVIDRMFDTLRAYLKDEDLSGFMSAYAELSAKYPDAFDVFMDEVLAAANVNDVDALFRKAGVKE